MADLGRTKNHCPVPDWFAAPHVVPTIQAVKDPSLQGDNSLQGLLRLGFQVARSRKSGIPPGGPLYGCSGGQGVRAVESEWRVKSIAERDD